MVTQAADREVTGYRLVVPDGWYGIDLAPERREQSVAALVARQFSGADNVPHLKAQARRDLLARATATHEAGGIEMFLSLQQVAGVPVAASLVIFLVPPDDGRAVAINRFADMLVGGDRSVTIIDLPAGKSARVFRTADPQNEPESAVVEVFVPVPGSGWWLLLAFAAPTGPLLPALTGLFDAICTTLRWDQ